jgi:hypothetical protein
MPQTTGDGRAFVASSRPPMPTSTTAASTPSACALRRPKEAGSEGRDWRGSVSLEEVGGEDDVGFGGDWEGAASEGSGRPERQGDACVAMLCASSLDGTLIQRVWGEVGPLGCGLIHLENVEPKDCEKVEKVQVFPRRSERVVDVPKVDGESIFLQHLATYTEPLPHVYEMRRCVEPGLVACLPEDPLGEAAGAALALCACNVNAAEGGEVHPEDLATFHNLPPSAHVLAG